MGSEKNIDKLFSQKLKYFGKNPPESVWTSIQEEIAAGRRRKFSTLFFRIAAGLALLLGLGIGGSSLLHDKLLKKNTIAIESEDTSRKLEDQKLEARKEEDWKLEARKEEGRKLEGRKLEGRKLEGRKLEGRKEEPQRLAVKKFEDQKLEGNNSMDQQKKQGRVRVTEGLARIPIQIQLVHSQDRIPIPENAQLSWHQILQAYSEVPEQEPLDKNNPSWSLAAVMAPVYSYRDISDKDVANIKYFNSAEKGKMNFSGGLQFGMEAGSRLSFQTGLVYSRIGIGVNNIYSYDMNLGLASNSIPNNGKEKTYTVSNSIGSIMEKTSNNILVSTSNQQSDNLSGANGSIRELMYNASNVPVDLGSSIDQYFHMLELPFMVKYKLVDREVDFNLLGGFSTNFLLGNETFIKSEQNSTYLGETKDVRSFSTTGNIGFGMGYEFIKSLTFTCEPQLKYYLNSINKEEFITARPYTIGIFMGVKYIF